jgi:C-terminal processing protease CtpA/Prc
MWSARRGLRRGVSLIDGAASTGEQFILDARQSRKVTLFGQRNSAGILDFANVVAMASPSGRVHVQWATSRSLRLPDDPVDPDGIAPDVAIDRSVRDPIAFVQAWLERQVD